MRVGRALILFLVLAIGIGVLRDELTKTYVAMPFRLARLYTQPADDNIRMPVEGVRRRAVADTWHAPRPGGRQHHGQDIFARRGTPVLAAADGIVVRFGGGNLGGNAVFVTGRGARTYYYAHLDRYAEGLKIGDFVTRGQVLGYVGNTGNAKTTAPHLHFGVYTATGPINPLPLIEPVPSD